MQILLNITEQELSFIGGDQTYYRNLEAAGKLNYGFTARYLQHSSTKARQYTRLIEGLSRHIGNNWLQSYLMAQGRQMPVNSADLQNVDVVASAILVARLPKRSKVTNMFLSQGINAPDYYQYQGNMSVDLVAAYYRHIAPHITGMLVATHDGIQRLKAMCPNLPCPVYFARHLVLTDGIASLEDKSTVETQRLRILFVGRDYVRKGLPEVMLAFEAICNDAELHVVTSETCPLKESMAHLPSVHWYSRLSDNALQDLYRTCHILASPTHADTYNLTMVEAMAYGCAIITSDLAPMGEIAPPSVVGEIVPRGNVEALREVMKKFVTDQELLQRYMQGALDHFRTEHSPAVVIRDTIAAFEQAIRLIR